jgi:hypothetical protein
VKKFYYHTMYLVCDGILRTNILDRDHFARWWEASEYYRRKRDRG